MSKTEEKPEIESDAQLDASDLYCPLPVLRAKKALDQMSDNSVLKVIATDPGSEKDIKAFTEQAGHKLVATDHGDNLYIFYIEKTIS